RRAGAAAAPPGAPPAPGGRAVRGAAPMTTPATVDSTIHDIGYQRYTGPRLGRAHAVAAIYLYSVRSAFGLGRTAKAKIFPFLIAGIMLVVAVVLAAVRAQFGITVLT